MNNHTRTIQSIIEESIAAKARMLTDTSTLETIEHMAEELAQVFKNGGKLLIAGNGGSAADAQHFAAEITCQFMLKRKARPALALHTDTSALTAWSNDYSFATAFARQVEAFGRAGDALVVISTSGNSENLVNAAVVARAQGMRVFGLLGRDGGKITALNLCDAHIIAPSQETPRIQECHTLVIHILCEFLDQSFADEDSKE